MLYITLFISIHVVKCDFNDTAYKIKYILDEYAYNGNFYNPKIDYFINKTIDLYRRTSRLAEVWTDANVSECSRTRRSDRAYYRRHFDSLLIRSDLPEDLHWNEYKAIYNKVYNEAKREMIAREAWRKNFHKVVEHNRHYVSGQNSYSLQLNHFADMDASSYFKNVLKLFDAVPKPFHSTYRTNRHHALPREVDWRRAGFRPRREEQWKCGACYAFAVAHALQAQLYRNHGDWTELSPQQIVDCSAAYGNKGCDGGSLPAAMSYVALAGLIGEREYPYIGKRGRCHYNKWLVRARPRRWGSLPPGDEGALEHALATIGPLAVGVNAAPVTFQLYRSGVYDDPFCVPWTLNHAMLLVGYTPQYWVLLNWWGRHWGEDGYIRIRRGFNVCGVANLATYVKL